MIYLLTPLLAWLVAGSLKFAINSIRAKRLALDLVGYGGMPSNHSAIVSSTAAMIGLREGMNHPAFGVALTLAFIVVLDASSLRRQVGKHAAALNQLQGDDESSERLRERLGHSRLEVAAGILVGTAVAIGLNTVLS